MPPYPWLAEDDRNTAQTIAKISALRKLGTPYPEGYEDIALEDLQKQAQQVADNLAKEGIEQEGVETKEIVALIAYLQRLGVDYQVEQQQATK